ncbi:MAG: ribonuclease P protein component [Alphaproteobacteria bacterium]|nr:ribonuclease P protein component [Alphaproteobacteria bacterium]
MSPAGVLRFSRDLRLRKRADYQRVQGNGRRHRERDLLLLYLPSDEPGTRVGITASRKVGGAVVRNRVKRWLREAIRHEHHALPAGLDVVIIAHASAADAGADGLRGQVRQAFGRIGRRGGR